MKTLLGRLSKPSDELITRFLAVTALGFGFGASRLTLDQWSLTYFFAGVAGILLAFGIVAVWGERTRPRFNLFWLLTILLLGGIVFATLGADNPQDAAIRYVPLALLVGLFIAHSHVLGPTLLIASPIFLAMFPPGLEWREATDSHAWFIAFSALFGLIAGTIERDRLHAQASPPIPWTWSVIRLGVVTAWTFLVLTFKEEIQVGRLFASLGLDPRGEIGRWALLALFIICLVAATFLFRGKKNPVPTDGSPPQP